MLWENLREEEFDDAIVRSGGLCIVPVGCLEKHGQHLPVGTDVIHITEIASYLCLVICGMRIAGKYKSKKQNENLTENFQKTIDK